MAKTTKQHFRLYKKAVREYYKKYRLSGWHLYFEHGKDSKSLARVWADTDTKAVVFYMSRKWKGVKPSKKRIRRAAKHEVIHLLLWPLHSAGWGRFTTEEKLTRINETVSQHITEIL